MRFDPNQSYRSRFCLFLDSLCFGQIMASSQQVQRAPPPQDRSEPSLRTDFNWTLAGNVVYSLCQWGMLSVLAKAGNASIVGQFALALAIAAPVFMFTNLALRGVQVSDVRREYQFGDYFTVRFVTTLGGLLVIATVVLFLHLDNTTRAVTILIALAKSLECVSDVIGGLLQVYGRLDQAAVSLMIRGGLSVIAFGGTFLFSHNLVACCAAMCLAWAAVLVGYDLRRAANLLHAGETYFHWDWGPIRKLVVLSSPLGLVMMLLSLNANIPRYTLQHYGGPAEVGIFASLAYPLVAMSTVVNALGVSAIVRLSSMFAVNDFGGFKKLMYKLVGIGVAMTALGLLSAGLFGRIVLTLLYRPEYADRMVTFLIMVAAGGVGAVGCFLGTGVTAARCFLAQVPLTAACTLTVVVTTAVLVPRYRSVGAALALLGSSIVFVVGCAVVLRMAFRWARKAQIESGKKQTG
jgi:O-antigen/teichoic acid export membrane protein